MPTPDLRPVPDPADLAEDAETEPDKPPPGAGPEWFAGQVLVEQRRHNRVLEKSLGVQHGLLVEIRDRLPTPAPAHPEVDEALASAKVGLLNSVRAALSGPVGTWLVRLAFFVVIAGGAAFAGLELDLVKPGPLMPKGVAEALGYAEAEGEVVDDVPATSGTAGGL